MRSGKLASVKPKIKYEKLVLAIRQEDAEGELIVSDQMVLTELMFGNKNIPVVIHKQNARWNTNIKSIQHSDSFIKTSVGWDNEFNKMALTKHFCATIFVQCIYKVSKNTVFVSVDLNQTWPSSYLPSFGEGYRPATRSINYRLDNGPG